jgi:hypothetical protein
MSTSEKRDLMCRRCNMPVDGAMLRVDKDGHPVHESCYIDELVESTNPKKDDVA